MKTPGPVREAINRALLMLCVYLACHVAHAETITLAVEDQWVPYSNPDGTGISNQLVIAAFKKVGVDVKLVVRPYARVVYEIENGTWVGGFNVSREPSTESRFIWTRETLMNARIFYYHHAARPLPLRDASELIHGERIGGITGYEYGPQFYNNDKIDKQWVNTHQQNLDKLLTGQLDAVLMFEKTGELLIHEQHLEDQVKIAFPAETSEIHVVFSRKHPQAQHYADLFDQGLRLLRRNGRYRQILAQLGRLPEDPRHKF